MLNYILEVNLCWLGFYLIYLLFLSKETFFQLNRWYLISTLILGLLIPIPEWQLTTEPSAMQFIEPITLSFEELEATIIATTTQTHFFEQFNFLNFLFLIYCLGVAITLSKLSYGFFQIFRLYKNGSISKMGNYYLVQTNSPHLPFSFFNFLFWSKSMHASKEDIQKIIRHEKAHIQQWHSIDVILIEILCVFLWCSPLIYFYKKSLRVVHEYLADAFVLETTQKKQYGHLLLKQTRSGLQLALANNFIHSQLKKRIVMMTRNHSTRSAMGKYLFMLPILAVLVMAFTNKIDKDKIEAFPIDILNEQAAFGEGTYPYFKGCESLEGEEAKMNCTKKKVFEFILNNLKYPSSAKAKNIEGKVLVQFTIDTDGYIKDATIIQGIGGGCDKEALRVVNAMPNWTPANKEGKKVAVQQTLPFLFKLPKEDNSSAATSTLKVAEEMPRFPGCEDLEDSAERKKCSTEKLFEFIFQNLKYPELAKENGTQGTVVVKFVVKSDGSITKAMAVKNIGNGCGKEAVRVINAMPKWIPGKQKGKLVDVEFNLPIKYRLDDDTDSSAKEKKADEGEAFKVVDEMPCFLGCEDLEDSFERKRCSNKKLVEFIYQNLKYPKQAKENGTQGTVVIKLVVKNDGSISHAKITNDIGDGCGEEALRVINLMPTWTPGKHNGKVVDVELNIPIKYKIDDPNVKEGSTYLLTPNNDGEHDYFTISELPDYPNNYLKIYNRWGEIVYESQNYQNDWQGTSNGKEVISGFYYYMLKSDNGKTLTGHLQITREEKTGEVIYKNPNYDSGGNLKSEKSPQLELQHFKVHPNPSDGQMTIELQAKAKPTTISIFDSTGKEVYHKELEDYDGSFTTIDDLNLKGVAKGQLFILIRQEGEKGQFTKAIILE